MECNFSMNPKDLDNLEQQDMQPQGNASAASLTPTRSQTLPIGKPPLASEPNPKRRKQPEASSNPVASLARMDSGTSSSPRIGTGVQGQVTKDTAKPGEAEAEAAHSALVKAVGELTQSSVAQRLEVESQVAASVQGLADLLKDKQLTDSNTQTQTQIAPAAADKQACDRLPDGTCAPSPFAAFMGFDPEAELDTITSGLEGFQSPAPHKAQNAHSRQGYMPHTKGPLSRAASGQTSSERTMSGAASRQVSIYPEMEHSLVAPEHLYNPAHHPSPRLTAALLRALSTPKAMSAARALSMLYPGLERPEVIEQLQQQSDKHAASPERRGSEWLSYPGMERGMSTSSHQGAPRQSQQQLSQQSQHTQQQQAQQQHAQHAGSMNRQPSDWLSYPGLERGFSVQSRRQQQQQPRSYALSSAESIRRKASGSVSDSESEQCASAQHKSAQQQLISAFAYAAAMPMSREPSGQFSYPGMERGFSGARHMATSPQQQPQQPPLQGHQARAASMQRNASDWLSYPGMERGLSTQQPKQPAQPTQQPTPPAQQPRAASMQRNPSDWLSYPGMERGLSRNLAQTRHQSPQRHPRQLSPLKPQAERAQAERAASMQRSPSDWLSYPGMERGLSMHPQQPQAAPSAAQPRSNAPLSRKASEWLSYPGMERGLSTQLPQSRLHQALCLETSYSIRSNASDSMWPGLEQCLEMSSNPSHSRLCQALCLESAPSVSSHYSDCDWPGLEADFDCSRSPSPDARLRDALCLESAASMRSNVSDCYYPGLERVMSMQSAAPALQRLLSIANQSPLQHALCLETSASVRSNLSECLWPGLEQCFAINSPPTRLQQALCLETAASVISNLSDMMLSYPGMESELLYPLSRAASLRSAPAGEPGVALGQGTAGSFQVQAKTEKGPEAAHVQTTSAAAGVEQAREGRSSSKVGSPKRAWSPSPLSRASSAAKPLPLSTSPLGRLNKAVVSRMSSAELPTTAHLNAAKLHPQHGGSLAYHEAVRMEQD